jgi:hypothetical protein
MASSSPLHSAFWLYPWQRFLVSSLLALSAGALVHTQYFARLLRQLSPPCPIYTQPVFPTFSPLHTDSTETKRQAQLLIFGSPAHRKRIYAATSSCLRQLIDEGRIEEIIDIGAPFESKKYFHTLPVQKLGLLSEQEIVPYLCRSSFGAVEYATKFLGKSTIFANYAAFGVCPILLGDGERDREPAEYSVGKHFLLSGWDASENAVQTIVQHNFQYALEHSLERYAQNMKKYLLDPHNSTIRANS